MGELWNNIGLDLQLLETILKEVSEQCHALSLKTQKKGSRPLPLKCSGWWAPNGLAHLGPGPAWSPIRAQPHGWS